MAVAGRVSVSSKNQKNPSIRTVTRQVPQASRPTTMVIRNLPEGATQERLLEEIDGSGFAGTYDFAYRPQDRHYAFVNFKTLEAAVAFAAEWHGTTRLGVSPGATALSIEAASVQGFRENVANWTPSRITRAKNAAYPPFISEEASPTNQVTTLAVRNLPEAITQQDFLDEVNRSGFAGKYDFAYLPRQRQSGLGGGHAFLNFTTVQAAATFQAAWHKSVRFTRSSTAVALDVAPSLVQGFNANAAKWNPARMAKAKNAVFLPFIVRSTEHA